METANVLTILNIIVNAVIGIWIAVIVNNRFRRTSTFKNYYIDEIKEIRKLYSSFLSNIFSSKYSSKYIKNWLSVMNKRIDTLEKSVLNTMDVNELDIKYIHFELYLLITGNDDFNNDWGKDKLVITESLGTKIIEKNTKLNIAFNNAFMLVNVSKMKSKKKIKNNFLEN
jgi:hypothetical protein